MRVLVGLAVVVAMWQASAAGQQASNPVIPPAATMVHRDIAYVTGGHERQRLDLYLPGVGSRPVPLIVAIHGGGWSGGDKNNHANTAWLTPILLNAGYGVASLNYRFSQHALFPAQIHDVKAAVRWLRANAATYGLDPARFGAWGASSGGHLATLLGTSSDVAALNGTLAHADQSTRVEAVINWYGPIDFLQMDAHRLPGGIPADAADSAQSRLLGGLLQSRRLEAAAANPTAYVTRDDPPFLILHGDKDLTVPHHQSELLRDALRVAGVAVEFQTVAGGGHGGPLFQTPEIAQRVVRFFDRHVKRSTKPSRIRGVWQLVEVIAAGAISGTTAQPGQYIFTDSHYSFTRVTANNPRSLVDRPQFAEMTADQFRELTDFVGEAGTYELEGSVLTIHRRAALLPVNMIPNNSASFVFDVQGDTLTLTPRTRADGAPLRNNATLKFRRIE